MSLKAVYPGGVIGGSPLYIGFSIADVLYFETVGTHEFAKDNYPGLRAVLSEGVGGGGGSGGAEATTSGQASSGGGGGGGCYCRKFILFADLDDITVITIGDGGGAGVAPGPGGDGEATSFGTHWTANGGTGGPTGVATTAPAAAANNGGAGGLGSGADLIIPGETGEGGFCFATRMRRASGGRSFLGHQQNPASNAQSTTGGAGTNATLYGCGGNGAINCQSQATARAGGEGSSGLLQLGLLY